MFYRVDKMVDVCGFLCPEPIIIIRKNLRFMSEGEIMLVIADDPTIKRDILFLCSFMKHLLLMQIVTRAPYCYVLKKGGSCVFSEKI